MAIYNGGLNIIAQDISGKEDKSNKVTAWSSTTTHEHYPSEKLVKGALDTKVNTANVLTYEQIMASTDLSGKVASAKALKDNFSFFGFHNEGESLSFTTFNSCLVVINGAGNDHYYIGILSAYNDIDALISDGAYDKHVSYDKNTGLLTLPAGGYYRYAIIF